MANTTRWHLRPATRASIIVIVRRVVSRIVDVVTFGRIVALFSLPRADYCSGDDEGDESA